MRGITSAINEKCRKCLSRKGKWISIYHKRD